MAAHFLRTYLTATLARTHIEKSGIELTRTLLFTDPLGAIWPALL